MDEKDWNRLVHQLRHGDCTPFLGAGAVAGTLPTARELSEDLAARYDYPFGDSHNLARVTEYAVVSQGYDSVETKFAFADRLNHYPRPLAEAHEPHTALAAFPISVYITTNYDDFMLNALRAAGKAPQLAICPWNEPRWDEEVQLAAWDPTPEQPLVFHLHGQAQSPSSLVLTEGDYLDFLIRLAEDRSTGKGELLPPTVLRALTTQPLLFLGYGVQDWPFRTVFQGLLRTMPSMNRRRSISVTLMPPTSSPGQHDAVRRYLAKYLDGWNISIYIGTVKEFFRELHQRAGG
ncbi:hypothetical protein Acor_72720 [Acrocarpospora corrugata]|uniref:Uncharacterized protein n=1 Tax=Acrocarpospora corrugata TaxID=35763 RepID=A0A5M3W8M0_9ACTN|nr:SIR2 family protein [Acrocarpospora corrugata]GES05204.1 hypothetical protein Acor_72720 [Acrocarpospora corrugata]